MKSFIIFLMGIFIGEAIAVILLALCSANDRRDKEEKDGANGESN